MLLSVIPGNLAGIFEELGGFGKSIARTAKASSVQSISQVAFRLEE